MNLSNKLNLILEEYSKGNKQSAYKKFKKIYLQNNKNIRMRFNLAVMQQELGLLDEAESNYKSIISNNAEIKPMINLYNLYISKNMLYEALELTNSIKVENSELNQVNQDRAYLLFLLKKYDDSIAQCNEILKIDNKNIHVLNTLGLCYFALKNYDNAKEILHQALNLDKKNIEVLNSIGRLNHELRKSKEAETYFLKAIKLNPNIFETLNNIAGFYLEETMYSEAINYFKKAEFLRPDNAVLLNNIAKAYLCLEEINKAEKYCRSAISKDKISDDFKKTLSLILLKKYDFENAWSYFDGRLGLADFIVKNSTLNLVKHKIPKIKKIKENAKILVLREQGIGDEILYASMYPDLLEKFPNAKIECDERLIPLFKNSFNKKENSRFVKLGYYSSKNNEVEKFDHIIFAGSLGKYFRKNLKSFPNKPFLKRLNNYKDIELEEILKKSKGIKIGISWKSFKNRYASEKSLEIKDFINFLEIKNATIFNLQYGNIEKELNDYLVKTHHNILTLKNLDLFNNFSGLANVLTNLDFFVTVSNSTAHLASGLGVKTILIKPANHASFHYWDYDDGKTPWYKSVEIISKDKLKDKEYLKKIIKI